MKKYKIAAVSYLNTLPFVYGLNECSAIFDVMLVPPAKCAEMLETDEVDIALVPVGALLKFFYIEIVSPYCIGAKGAVNSVFLISNTPLKQIVKVYCDPHSYTSNALVKILSKYYWNCDFSVSTTASYPPLNLEYGEAFVAIGDKTFGLKTHFNTVVDLSIEWNKFTKKPFVFAVWISKKTLDISIIEQMNLALKFGISNIKNSISFFNSSFISAEEAIYYLENNIKYNLNKEYIVGMEMFLQYIDKDIVSKICYRYE